MNLAEGNAIAARGYRIQNILNNIGKYSEFRLTMIGPNGVEVIDLYPAAAEEQLAIQLGHLTTALQIYGRALSASTEGPTGPTAA